MLRRFGIKYIQIPPQEFDFGRTKNMAVKLVDTPFVCFLSQDAVPKKDWLLKLLEPFKDKDIIGTFSRQIPNQDCHKISQERILRHYVGYDRVYRFTEQEYKNATPEERMNMCRFDNVASCIRRELLLKYPFPEGGYGEDIIWAKRVLKEGFKIVYSASSIVKHCHPFSIREDSRRAYIYGKIYRMVYGIVPYPLWRVAGSYLRRFPFNPLKLFYELVIVYQRNKGIREIKNRGNGEL